MCHLTCYRSSGKIAGGTDADLAIEHDPTTKRGNNVYQDATKKKKGGPSLLAVVLSSPPHSPFEV